MGDGWINIQRMLLLKSERLDFTEYMILSVYNLFVQYMHNLYQSINNLDSLSFFGVKLLEQMCSVIELFSRGVPELYLCLPEFRGGGMFPFLL